MDTEFLLRVRDAAIEAKHPWPEYVACEASIATGDGSSDLAKLANNIFAFKAPQNLEKDQKTITLKDKSFSNDGWQEKTSVYLKFETLADCIAYRLHLLKRFNMYANALRATTGEDFIMQLCGQWQRIPDKTKRNSQTYQFGEMLYLFMAPRFYIPAGRAQQILSLYAEQVAVFTQPAAKVEDAPVIAEAKDAAPKEAKGDKPSPKTQE